MSEEEESLVQETLHENQRGLYAFGRFQFSSKALMLFDPKVWTYESGHRAYAGPKHFQLPSEELWEWASEWMVDMSTNCDRDGWQYAFNFNSSKWSARCTGFRRFVRQRRWIRFRRKKVAASNGDESCVGSSITLVNRPEQGVIGSTPASVDPQATVTVEVIERPKRKGKGKDKGKGKGRETGTEQSFNKEPQTRVTSSPWSSRPTTSTEGAHDDTTETLLQRLREVARVDRERLVILQKVLELDEEDVLKNLSRYLAMFDYDYSKKKFLELLLRKNENETLASPAAQTSAQSFENELGFYSYKQELGVGIRSV